MKFRLLITFLLLVVSIWNWKGNPALASGIQLDTVVKYLQIDLQGRPNVYCLELEIPRAGKGARCKLLTFDPTHDALVFPPAARETIAESFAWAIGLPKEYAPWDTIGAAELSRYIRVEDFNADGREDVGLYHWSSGNANVVYDIYVVKDREVVHWPQAPNPILEVAARQRTITSGWHRSAREAQGVTYRISGDTVLTPIHTWETEQLPDGRIIRTDRHWNGTKWLVTVDSNYTTG